MKENPRGMRNTLIVLFGLLATFLLFITAHDIAFADEDGLRPLYPEKVELANVSKGKFLLLSPKPEIPFHVVDRVVTEFGGELEDDVQDIGIYRAFFDVPPSDAEIAALREALKAKFVEREGIVGLLDVYPNDPKYGSQWASRKIGLPKAWEISLKHPSSTVVVAVIDTGVDTNHPDLKASLMPASTWYDFGSEDSNPADTFGHGTHVSGIVAAGFNNNIGIAGTGTKVKLMPIKVFPDGSGSTSTARIAKGIVFAVDQHADIINLSVGSSSPSEAMKTAVEYAYSHGVLVIAAAGNTNSNVKFYPAAYSHVLAVGATDREDKKAPFSNYGSWLDLSAPGVYILSTMPYYHVKMNDYGYQQGYDYMSGTSMSAPLVAGVASLVKSMHPDWSVEKITELLKRTSSRLFADPQYDGKLGSGRLNAAAVMEEAETEVEPITTPTLRPTLAPKSPTPKQRGGGFFPSFPSIGKKRPTSVMPTPTPTPRPTPTNVPTSTPRPTPTNVPTSAPRSTPTAAPTSTPTPKPTATSVPTLTPTPNAPPVLPPDHGTLRSPLPYWMW